MARTDWVTAMGVGLGAVALSVPGAEPSAAVEAVQAVGSAAWASVAPGSWGFALLWIVACLLAAGAVDPTWRRFLLPLARRTPSKLNVLVLEASRGAARMSVLSIGLYAGASFAPPTLPAALGGQRLWIGYQGLTFALLVFSLAQALYAVTRATVEWYGQEIATKTQSTIDDQFVSVFRKLAKLLFLFVALTIVLEHFDIRITAILATAGVASLAVAFAAQETLANMISGFVLMADRPFLVGDRIELADGKIGDVLEIGLRSTKILSFDNTVITIPNSEIAKNTTTNHNAPTPKFKVRVTLGVAYGTDLRRVKQILLTILQAHPDVLREPPPAVYFTEFGTSSLDLLYVAWIADYREQFRIRDDLNMAIKDQFEAARIEIPFPQHDLNIRSWPTPPPTTTAASRPAPGTPG